MIKPTSPGWTDAVTRAAGIIRDHQDWTDQRLINFLENCCQNVPLKHIPHLLKEAKASNGG